MIKTEDFTKWVTALLAETFGVSDSDSIYIMDSGQAGLLGTLATLGADTASFARKPEHATIASHSAHILFLLQLFDSAERGQSLEADWSASWKVRQVNETDWKTLRADLHSMYAAVQAHLEARVDWPEPALSATLMLLTHCAYHTGEIKQLVTSLAD